MMCKHNCKHYDRNTIVKQKETVIFKNPVLPGYSPVSGKDLKKENQIKLKSQEYEY